MAQPIDDRTDDEGPALTLRERVAKAAREADGPRVTVHDDGTTEIELEVYAITGTALPRPDHRTGIVKRFTTRISGKREQTGTVRYVTRRP